jgi:hypothetical protein
MLLAVVIFYLSGVFGDKHSLDAETRNALIITANGPAIWGGCVTRREHRAPRVLGAGTLARKLSRCKEGMAHFLPSWYKF